MNYAIWQVIPATEQVALTIRTKNALLDAVSTDPGWRRRPLFTSCDGGSKCLNTLRGQFELRTRNRFACIRLAETVVLYLNEKHAV